MPALEERGFIVARATAGVQRPRRWTPSKTCLYVWAWAGRKLEVLWHPRRGFHPLSLSGWGRASQIEKVTFPDLMRCRVKRFAQPTPEAGPTPALSSESKVFAKLPRLREFLTATAYDDGTARAPGRIWLENDGVAFVATLFEPAAYLRAKCRAASMDDALQLAEQLLAMDSPPWEVDTWARDRAAQKKKK